MKREIATILLCVSLAGCGPSPTPLSRAVTALRAGDRDGFAAARKDAEAAVKGAIQPGDDLCKANIEDVNRYHALYAIRKMDHADLFRLPDEDRLAYALQTAGRRAHVWKESFLTGAPQFYQTRENENRCRGSNRDWNSEQLSFASASMNENEARTEALVTWIDAVKTKHAEKYDDRMRSAVNHLAAYGYTAKWPPDVSLD